MLCSHLSTILIFQSHSCNMKISHSTCCSNVTKCMAHDYKSVKVTEYIVKSHGERGRNYILLYEYAQNILQVKETSMRSKRKKFSHI